MTDPGHLSLVDLLIALVIIVAAIGTLRRGGGVLAAAASACMAALLCWLVAGGLLAWGPERLGAPVRDSALLTAFPAPVGALTDMAQVFSPSAGPAPTSPGPSSP